MPSSIAKDSVYIRKLLKITLRDVYNLKKSIDSLLDQVTATGVLFDGVDPTTGVPADPEAVAAIGTLTAMQTFLNNNRAKIAKGADFGDNIA